jgi:hypothetical protein
MADSGFVPLIPKIRAGIKVAIVRNLLIRWAFQYQLVPQVRFETLWTGANDAGLLGRSAQQSVSIL